MNKNTSFFFVLFSLMLVGVSFVFAQSGILSTGTITTGSLATGVIVTGATDVMDTTDEVVTTDVISSTCSYYGDISVKPTNEKLHKIRLKVLRPEDNRLILKKNYVPMGELYTEQKDAETYFTFVAEEGGFLTLPDDGVLLDFTIEGPQDYNRIAMKETSYVQLEDDTKIYVTEDPIYMNFYEHNCVQEMAGEFQVSFLSPEKVDIMIPDNTDVSTLLFTVDRIPYQMEDATMVTYADGVITIAPIVPLIDEEMIDITVADGMNDIELFSKRMLVTQNGIDNEGRLMDIAQRSQEERMLDIHDIEAKLSQQECDILSQVKGEVLTVHEDKIKRIIDKLDCQEPTATPALIAFKGTHGSAGTPAMKTSSTMKFISYLGWLFFLALFGLHMMQKVRRRNRMTLNAASVAKESAVDSFHSDAIPLTVAPENKEAPKKEESWREGL